MELKLFVAQSIMEVIEGVAMAQKAAAEIGARVAPIGDKGSTPRDLGTVGGRPIYSMKFEVAVSAEGTSEANGKISVLAGIFGGSAGANSAEASSSATRISFEVAYTYPDQPKKAADE